jgi:hypothetical protein
MSKPARLRVGISRDQSRVVIALRHTTGANATAVMKTAAAASWAACLLSAVNSEEDAELELELRAAFTANQGTP